MAFFSLVCTVLVNLAAPADSLSRPDSAQARQLDEVVISASRVPERILRSPVSIDVLDARQIRQSAQPSYFDALENLKGVQLLTTSLGFKVYNTRGFANPTNVRFVQLVDGRDNQAPHIGAPIANALAPSDLDMQRVELIGGTASALYGMNALNGLANLITRNPFDTPGLSVSQKTGLNHVGAPGMSARLFSESSVRYAHVFSPKLALKINAVYQRGYDWIARNPDDLNPTANASLNLFGADNPARDLVNSYGNEAANRRSLTLNGRRYVVARTGYFEDETTDYRLQNLRGDASLFYRFRPGVELVYTFQGATLDNIYQRTNRFRLENYRLSQHSLTFTTPSVQLRAYRSGENTGQSYNIRSMAENIERSFKSDDRWFADFADQFRSSVGVGVSVPEALRAARVVADLGRPQPGSAAFAEQVARLRDINDWDVGAALRVKSWLYHLEGQVEPTQAIWAGFRQKTGISLLVGFDVRQYVLYPDGNYFINPDRPGSNLNYAKAGAFVQVIRTFWEDKLKLTASLRVDKNSYFAARLNPRVSAVFSPTDRQSLRISYQNGYRFPSLFEAFSNVNSGGVKRVGGLPLMARGIFERSYVRTSIDAFQVAINADVNTNRLTTEQAIQQNQGLLRRNPYTYLKPEQVNSFEMGYKAYWLAQRLWVDADVYYNVYRNFMAQVEANIPRGTNPDSIAYLLADRTKQDRYRLWTNSQTTVFNYGASLALRYRLAGNWLVGGNASLARLDRKESGDGLEEAFNTPTWIANLSVSNADLGYGLGFSVNYKHQSAFLWQSSLATAVVPAIHTFDAQLSYPVRRLGLHVKLGGTNLLNRPYVTFAAGPSGGFYYTALVWEGM